MSRPFGTLTLVLTAVLFVACASTPPPQPATAAPGLEASTPASTEESTQASARASAPAGSSDESPAAPETEPESYKNTLRWTTASEVDNFGFDVYRGDSEEGPFVRLTKDPLPGAGTDDTPTKYEFVDDTIDPDRAYWYYVEAISIHGVREHFTPVFRAKPKREPANED